MARKATDQASKRRGNIWKDQHGREWGGTMDRMSGMPIGELIPINGTLHKKKFGWWPVMYQKKLLIPGMEYFVFDDERLGHLVIDYAKWRSNLEVAHNRWFDQAMSYAQALHGEMAGKALENPTIALRTLCGPKPMVAEVIEKMIEGDEWILGLDPKRPEWANELLPEDAPRVLAA